MLQKSSSIGSARILKEFRLWVKQSWKVLDRSVSVLH
jgi:hypothetical protein